MPDGTVKQTNPFTGTQVWTVPGRAHRPLPTAVPAAEPLEPDEGRRMCAFCADRYLETTPERRRVVRDGEGWTELRGVGAEEVFATTAEVRVVPNLFEILPFEYWRLGHGHRAPRATLQRQADYLSTSAGREHLRTLVETRRRAAGLPDEPVTDGELAGLTLGMFAGTHDVVIARRHVTDEATTTADLASAGTLTPEEHAQYVAATVRTAHDTYADNPFVRMVSIFQNWLRPAGASFDHLHKQVVGVDDHGPDLAVQLERLPREPDMYQRWGIDYAHEQGLVIARTEHAVLTAGVGHRYPAMEVWSLAPGRPWELDGPSLRSWSDLLHAAHAATGHDVPCNEEWHHQPPDVDLAMPLRAILKWRISTVAGFEGGTRIYLSTIDPWTVAERVRGRLAELAAEGRVAPLEIVGQSSGSTK